MSPRKVLVVDDEPKIAEVVGSYLRAGGFTPVATAGGAEALRLFDQERPCLVILDPARWSAAGCAPAPGCRSSC
jgi:DNA-binding response OmpR family regulator